LPVEKESKSVRLTARKSYITVEVCRESDVTRRRPQLQVLVKHEVLSAYLAYTI